MLLFFTMGFRVILSEGRCLSVFLSRRASRILERKKMADERNYHLLSRTPPRMLSIYFYYDAAIHWACAGKKYGV